MCSIVGVYVIVRAHAYLFFWGCVSVCDPVRLLGGPTAWSTWHIAFPAEEGAGAAVRKHSGKERDLLSTKDQT